MASNSVRDTSLDFISGLLIIHMMLGHAMSTPFIKIFNVLQCFFFFYMPWFFFKSGMFFKAPDDLKSFAKKKADRLLKPFLFFSLLGEPLYYLDCYLQGSNWYQYIASTRTFFYLGNFVGNPPCWFLLSLFVILIVCALFWNRLNKGLVALVLFGLLLVNQYFNPFPIYSVVHTVSGCLFFILGSVMKEFQYSKPAFITSLAVLLLAIPCNSFVGMYLDVVEFGNYILWYVFSFCAIIVINNVARFIPSEIFISKFFVWVGQNAMLLLVTHWLVLIALKIIFLNTGILHETWQFVLVSTVTISILTPLLNKLMSKVTFIKL